MGKMLVSALGIVLALCVVMQAPLRGVSDEKMTCMRLKCCPAMKLCNKRCGNDGECFTRCENARMNCLKVKCGWTDDDAGEVFAGGDEPCHIIRQ